MKRILVTGGAGYIGGTVSKLLLEAGFDVTILDDCSTGHADSVDPRATFIEGSILERNAVLSALNGVDTVMHFAAKSIVPESMREPNLYHHVNVDGTKLLLDCMKEISVRKIVYSSTAAVYGDPTSTPIREDARTIPTNPYGETKLKVDQMLTARCSSDGLAAISLRYFNVAGALKTSSGWHAERHDPETHLIPNILKATPTRPLKLFGTTWPTPDGTCIRDYIHVVDLSEAHIQAMSHLVTDSHQIINLGSGTGNSVREVIDTASRVLGRDVDVVEEGPREGDPAILVASIEKAENVLGWLPSRNLERIIEDSFASLQS